jgi:hypothetical protein
MRQDQMSQSRELGMSQLEGALLNEIYRYAQSPRFARDMVEAFNYYWGGVYDLTGLSEIDPDDARRTVEWFVHDYHTSTDRRTVIDLLIERETAEMPEEAVVILRAWSASCTGLFRVINQPSGGLVALYDLLHEHDLEVYDTSLARSAREGDVVTGRLFELGGVKRMSFMTMLLPSAMTGDLVAYVTNAYNLYHEEHPSADWERFLRENGHIVNAYLLSPRAEAFHGLLGPGTRFHSPVPSRDRLRQLTLERAREQQREAQGEEAPAMHRSAGGIILPGVESATSQSETESPSRSGLLIPGRDF